MHHLGYYYHAIRYLFMTLLNVIELVIGTGGLSAFVLAFLCCSGGDSADDAADSTVVAVLMSVGAMLIALAVLTYLGV